MKFTLTQDGETLGEIETGPVDISGDIPDEAMAAVEAQATRPDRGTEENVVTEEWVDPTPEEIARRLISVAARRDFDVVTDVSEE